ncbi:TetR/AcrR family transcriptional regulator C-terminal domain-containing protein [Nocardia sp. NPDC024068]|uniref:TetR/AcrR family transcriptional regulator n=1 Tax=Nocardia sp. NPDC024068 TaxID=3157197 RepID=UPI0033FD82DC
MATPTVLELLWGTDRRPTRGPKPTLTRAAIVTEAVGLADTEGLAGLSMQRLADRLGYTKMSLYRHLPGKSELTALMLEAALGPPPEFDTAAAPQWRPGLRSWALLTFERYRRHPWVMELLTGARPIGPHELGWMDTALRALDGTALSGPERLDTLVVLNGHVRSLAQQLMSPGGNEAAFSRGIAASLEMAGDRFPAVLAALSEPSGAGAPGRDAALEFGIERILDGIAALLAERDGRGA